MIKRKYILLLVCLIAYAILRALMNSGIRLPAFFENHLADLLCMPVVLSVTLLFFRLILKKRELKLPFGVILFLTVYWSVYFEWYLPSISSNYTADMIDVLMYLLGASFFVIWQSELFKRPVRQEYYQ